jgi:hypothetical protein
MLSSLRLKSFCVCGTGIVRKRRERGTIAVGNQHQRTVLRARENQCVFSEL